MNAEEEEEESRTRPEQSEGLDGHLSDERLSSYIDGRAGDLSFAELSSVVETEQHLIRCGTCTARLASLRAARALVGSPVPPVSAERRSSAIAAALETPDTRDTPDTPDTSSVSGRSSSPWYRSSRVLTGVAAALIVLGGLAIALVVSRHNSPGSQTASSASAARSPAGRRKAPNSPSANTNSPGYTFGALHGSSNTPDLGRVGSESAVLDRLRALGSESVSGGAASSGSSTAAPAPEGAANPAAQSNEASAPTSQNYAVPAVPGAGTGAAANTSETSLYERCIAKIKDRLRTGTHGPGLVATVTFKGRNALVLEFWPTSSPPGPGGSEVAVVGTDGCKLLASSSY